jgi:hypothetical protein
MDDIETLLYHIDSSLHFLSQNPTVSETPRNTNSRFLTTLKKLVLIKEHSDPNSINELKKHLLSIRVINKQWLLEKLDELTGKN